MNIWVRTVDGELHCYDNTTVTFDATVLQVAGAGTCVTTFPLCNVIAFCSDEDEWIDPVQP